MTSFTFNDFLNQNKKFDEQIGEPIMSDWIDHLSTLFPQVRLKQYLEIRSMDACSWDMICSPAAFWTGLLYDEESLNKALNLMHDWTHEERLFLNLDVPKNGLNTKFRDIIILDIAKRLLEISEEGLKKRGNLSSDQTYDETYYLKNIRKNISKGMSPADYLLDKYENG